MIQCLWAMGVEADMKSKFFGLLAGISALVFSPWHVAIISLSSDFPVSG